MLDEIAGGRADHDGIAPVETIREIHACGVSIIRIEQVVHAPLTVGERLIVIDFGRKSAEGKPHTIMKSPDAPEICPGIEAER